ncbi:MAG: ABC transporter permease [Clostridia bacterium]|nr:ABC transporter permease [Clostridia bacterium]
MDKLWIVVKNILYRVAKNRSSILLHLIVPVAVVIGMAALFTSGSGWAYTAAVVDLSDSASSEYLINQIESSEKFRVVAIDREDADEYITEGMSSFVLVIPKDFEDRILSGDAPKVEMISLKESEGAAWMQVSLNMQISNLKDAAFGSEYNANTYYEIIQGLEDAKVKIEIEKVEDSSGNIYATQPLIGMYLMFVLMSASTTAFMILEEKRKGTFARIGTAPVSPSIYTMANVISNMVILTIQMSLVLILIKYVLKIDFYVPDYKMFIILFFYLLCGVGLGVLIASAVQKSGRANAIFYLILAPSCMISGCFWPIEFMPELLAKISVITPQRWAMYAISTAQKGGSILLPLMILFAYAALLFIGTAYFIKYKDKTA